MATALVPVFTGTIADRTAQLCCARTLHTFMQVRRDFSNWIKGRIRKFGFVANEDYLLAKSGEQVPHQGGTRTVERIDYHLTLDMAKELAMVENNEQGRAARRYFIECERQALAMAAPQPEPIQTALDYDRISTAQAQDLKEIINAIVAAKVHKTHGEAWARFQNKFRVNSYLELPATRHLEARQYLIAKLPGGYQGEVLAPVQDAERLQLAFDLATQTSAQVQRTVFNAVMEGAQDEWRYSRYLVAFTYDRLSDKPTLPWAKAVQHDQLIVSLDDLPRRIEGPDAVLATDAQLAAIARACLNRIEARAISA